MKILQVQTLNYLDPQHFSAIPNECRYDSHFMFSISYEPTLRKEIEQALLARGLEEAKYYGGTPYLYWKQDKNKKSRSVRHTCTMTLIDKYGDKTTKALSYSIHTLLI